MLKRPDDAEDVVQEAFARLAVASPDEPGMDTGARFSARLSSRA
jgi:DNA-directed RNA polymerase specialized sigma24 family protein